MVHEVLFSSEITNVAHLDLTFNGKTLNRSHNKKQLYLLLDSKVMFDLHFKKTLYY